MSLNFDTRGMPCALALGEPCPGKGMTGGPHHAGDSPGCPHWRTMVVQAEGGGAEEVWAGCGVLMDPHLMLGVAKGANRAAASVQSARNVIAGGFEDLLGRMRRLPARAEAGGEAGGPRG
ncbi:MAG: hypothetical protein V3V62_04275 [bacterium]